MKSQFFLPMAVGRIAFSLRLLSGWDAAVGEEHFQFVPLAEGVGDGFAGEASGHVSTPGLKFIEPDFEVLEDGGALPLACCQDSVRAGAGFAQFNFDPV